MKYFGMYKMDFIKNLSDNDFEELLYEDLLYEDFDFYAPFSELLCLNQEFNKNEFIKLPSLKLNDDFLNFLLNETNVNDDLSRFFIDFNNIIYGLNKKKQRKIALETFNDFFNYFDIKIEEMVDVNMSENGIIHIANKGKLYRFYMYLLKQKIEVSTSFITFRKYLEGDKEYFNNDFYDRKDIKMYLNTHMTSRILSQLNDIYKFEIDLYFTDYFYHSYTYYEYEHIFNSIESFHLTIKYLKNIKTILPSNIYALYEYLVVNELINKNDENFLNFIFDYFDLAISKIHKIDKNDKDDTDDKNHKGHIKKNLKHAKKLDEITFFWDKSKSLDYLK